MTVEEIQRQLAPKDDLTPYEGQWVALRDGHVVASALSAEALRDLDEVRHDDMILPVPPNSGGVFVL